MTTIRNAMIVGGGVGGMVAAIGLQRAGIATTVIEICARGERPGTGICLQGNALRALHQLDLAEECIATGFGFETVELLDHQGRSLRVQPMARTFQQDRPAAAAIRRAKLSEIFEHHAESAGADIRHEVSVSTVTQNSDGVDVTLTNGDQARVDLLVVADGAYSKTRALVFGPELVPQYTGQGGWRLTVPRPRDLDGFKLFSVPNTNNTVGTFPLSAKYCYFFYLENTPAKLRMPSDQLCRLFTERMEPFSAPMIRTAVQAMEGAHELSYRPFDILLVPAPWHRGRIVLLGDAAHSMTPQLTSGGGMAIEDAVVLSELLASHGDVFTALDAYSARRYRRVERVFNYSLQICRSEQGSSNSKDLSMQLLREGYEFLAQAF